MTIDDAMSALHLADWSLGEFGTDAGFTVQAHRGHRRVTVTALTASTAWLAMLSYVARQPADRK